ncbi:YmaF family protein [Bacillaceae bacterium C204]|uniref:YmaF family protein n=1 Tax=Neobacillus sp. 204 TaxID=3383351 RepID=UPI00397A7E91
MSKAQKGRENYERKKSQKEEQSNKKTNSEESEQTHVHEFLASTKLAEEGEDRHNHRFAGVTSEVIPKGDSHVHVILTNTDFLDHHHEVGIQTGPAIPVGNGKHVHFVKGITTLDDGHVHELEFATLIEKPLV